MGKGLPMLQPLRGHRSWPGGLGKVAWLRVGIAAGILATVGTGWPVHADLQEEPADRRPAVLVGGRSDRLFRNWEGEAPAEPFVAPGAARQEPRPPEPFVAPGAARQEPRPPEPFVAPGAARQEPRPPEPFVAPGAARQEPRPLEKPPSGTDSETV